MRRGGTADYGAGLGGQPGRAGPPAGGAGPLPGAAGGGAGAARTGLDMIVGVAALMVFLGALAALTAPLLRRPRPAVAAADGVEAVTDTDTAAPGATLLEERE